MTEVIARVDDLYRNQKGSGLTWADPEVQI